jgi:hypothetical protein
MNLFGELRACLHGAPTAQSWSEIVRLIDLWPDLTELEEQVIPYAAQHLARWPDALRIAPQAWLTRMLDGEQLPGLSLVRAVVAQGMSLRDAQVAKMAQSPALSQLRALDLMDNDIGPEGVSALLGAVFISTLYVLRLGDNRIGADGAQLIAHSSALKNLRALDLSNPRQAARTAYAMMRPADPRRSSLNVGIGALGALHLAQSPWLRAFEHLDLAYNTLNAAAARVLARAPISRSLVQLELSHNDIGSTGMAALCAEDASFQSLEVLSVRHNGISDDGAYALATSRLSTLRLVDLSLNRIWSGGMTALREAAISRGWSLHLSEDSSASTEPAPEPGSLIIRRQDR